MAPLFSSNHACSPWFNSYCHPFRASLFIDHLPNSLHYVFGQCLTVDMPKPLQPSTSTTSCQFLHSPLNFLIEIVKICTVPHAQSCQVEHVEYLESVTCLEHPDWLSSSSSSQVAPPNCPTTSSGAFFRTINNKFMKKT